MSKFIIGNKVIIRQDLCINETYGNDYFVSEMNEYLGSVATVVKVLGSRCNKSYPFYSYVSYKLDIDDEMWIWTDEMLEPVNEFGNELTFEEVIKNIQNNEVWVNINDSSILEKIEKTNDGKIQLYLGDDKGVSFQRAILDTSSKFMLGEPRPKPI